jgi:hypothetical protein
VSWVSLDCRGIDRKSVCFCCEERIYDRSIPPVFFAFVVPGAFGQIGLYGPVTAHVKAGDLAPDITFTKVLNAPVAGSWSQSNLSGQLTVLFCRFAQKTHVKSQTT